MELVRAGSLVQVGAVGERPVNTNRIVAIGLLTQENLEVFGHCLKKVYPVDETPCFTELLAAIDEADRELWRERDRNDGVMRF